MAHDAPPFWYKKPGYQAFLLAPFAFLYGCAAAFRMRRAQRQVINVPVICIGNFTVGGTGKTPTVIALANLAKQKGFTPGILTRGYGGTFTAPTFVDTAHHSAKYVGDEPLLLAKAAKTLVTKDRLNGAQQLIDEGVDLILMDDGFQSAQLHFDYALLVVDAVRGLGNERLIPAGPVRAPFDTQIKYAHALSVIGSGHAADAVIRITSRAAKPVFHGYFKARDPQTFQGLNCLAFAAIGDPDRFFRSLIHVGAKVAATRAFADHHYFSAYDVDELLETAEKQRLTPVTTRKDYVRLLAGHGRAQDLAERTKVLDIEMCYDDPTAVNIMIDETIKNYKKRVS